MPVRNRSISKAGLTDPPQRGRGDIGSAAHFCAVPPDRDDEPVREFRSFTADLNALADWLERCGVDTVAMESTGVYWIPLYELLDRRGMTVLLVNARHVKNVSGRKSDVLDCQWLQQLLSFGLLRGAFRPADKVCELRSITRQRATLLRSQARHVQHMQKALTQMNIQLANVISDVAGVTGQKIIRAIVAGERDPQELAAYRDVRIKAEEAQIAKSLQGTWRDEHLFALKQALAEFDFCGTQLAECDTEIERRLQALQVYDSPAGCSAQSPSARPTAQPSSLRAYAPVGHVTLMAIAPRRSSMRISTQGWMAATRERRVEAMPALLARPEQRRDPPQRTRDHARHSHRRSSVVQGWRSPHGPSIRQRWIRPADCRPQQPAP